MRKKSASSGVYNPHKALRAGIASVAVVSVLIVIKVAAYWVNGSASVLAALIDSCTDAAGSAVNLFAIRMSLRPPTAKHRHGHGKIEGLAALFQAAMIAAAAMFLAFESADRFTHPAEGTAHGFGIVVMLVSVLLSGVLVMVQKASLREAPSLAVEADQAHYGADIIVNVAVLAVLVAQTAGAPGWVDPALALVVAFWLLRTAGIVAKGGWDMLLDREVSENDRRKIAEIVRGIANVRGMHDLRTRMTGMNLHLSFDIAVDPDLSLRASHDIAKQVEARLLRDFPNAEIIIHVDPEDDLDDARHNIMDD